MSNSEITIKVQNYNGNNGFINSLQSGLQKYGSLTEKQLFAAGKFFTKLNNPAPTQQPKEVKVDIKITTMVDTKWVLLLKLTQQTY